jgi:heterodisulfide reductase subunit A
MKKSYGALVVGAGIAGIRTALDLAETGQKVALIDERPHIGGILSQLDHQFPSDHCGMCRMLPLTERDASSQFCMRKGLFHRNIDLMLSTELGGLHGDPGEFSAVLKTRSTFVDAAKCIGCGLCAEVCPVQVPSEFNEGLSTRSAIHLPVPHNIPNHYVVDLDSCQRCLKCVDACPTGAIDFKVDGRRDYGILVLEPDRERNDSLVGLMREHGFATRPATNVTEALEELNNGPRMVFLSLDLPEGAPERILARSLEVDADMPVVLLDSLQGEDREERDALIEKLRQAGAREVVSLPQDKKEFIAFADKLYMRSVSDTCTEIDAAAVVLACGMTCFDPAKDEHGMDKLYFYGSHPGVVTSLELERLLSSSGPGTGAELVRPGDGKPVKSIAWLQCVGSRDVRRNAGFCSSFCCMASLKETMLVSRKARSSGTEAPACTIFNMDMRTFGKEYERYREKAEQEYGVRMIRNRIHGVIPDHETGGISLQYVDESGTLVREVFDMVVLAVGARPPRNMDRLAEVADIERNDWGFCRTQPFSPSRTSRMGVMAAGSFAGPRDIAESVTVAGASALEASKLINLYAPLRERGPEPEPQYRDVSREVPRMMVALCTSCPLFENRLHMSALLEFLESMQSVVKVVSISGACSAPGWEQIRTAAEEVNPNRILIGACMPYAYVPKLRELGEHLGLSPALMDVVDLYSPIMVPEEQQRGVNLEGEILSRLNMAAVKLLGADPTPLKRITDGSREALVVGGGLSGMTAALGIADHGYDVCLVEESDHLGGLAMKLHYTLEGDDPKRFMTDLVDQVHKHPHIRVFTDSRISLSWGRAGRFMTLISSDEGAYPLEHGATVIATGGREADVYDYGFRVHKTVLSQRELENRLAGGELDVGGLSGVVMIQCWRSRDEERNYCSRVCCPQALKNALMLKSRRPELPVYVFYRDIMTYGFAEEYYTKARQAGVMFIRYTMENKPEVTFDQSRPVIRAFDSVLGARVEIPADLLVLAGGIDPGDNEEVAEIFGLPLNADGFFQEAETKWRPVDFLKHGIFVCGLAHGPGNMKECIASAKAAAQRTLAILSGKGLVASNVVAEIREPLCSRCGRCIEVCPYGARALDIDKDRIVVDELLCQGCGSCAAVCPNSAAVLRGFSDAQVLSQIDAALPG